MVSVTENLLASLGRLGFSPYEARAYCALLSRSPMNGHEVAKVSGVPTSKIYEALSRLSDKGAVLVQRSTPVSYAPSPFETVLAAARQRFDDDLRTAEAGLRQLPDLMDPVTIWSLQDRESVLAACAREIDGATQSVFAALWVSELDRLRASLERASARGLPVHVAIYGAATLNGPVAYDLTLCGESAVERLGGRKLSAVVADETHAIVAEFIDDAPVTALTTNNSLINLLAVEYIKADVLGRLLINDMGEDRFQALRSGGGAIEVLLRG